MKLEPMIRALRMEKHMTQIELAEKLGIDQTQLSRYEKGHRRPPLEILYNLEEILGCSLKDLYKRTCL